MILIIKSNIFVRNVYNFTATSLSEINLIGDSL